MNRQKEYLRHSMHLAEIITLTVAVLVSAFWAVLFSGEYAFSVNPIIIIKSIFKYGFPWKVFFSFILMGTGLSIIIICKSLHDGNVTDKKHPSRMAAENNIYGSAEFEKPWQYRSVAQIRRIENCVGHIFGQLDEKGKECIDTFDDPEDPKVHRNQNIFAIGPSGTGKSFTVGKTYCLQSIKMGNSVVHTDPKGELYRDLANIYREHGYIVRRLDFLNPEKSDGWDCMKVIREETNPIIIELNVATFASAVVSNIVDDPNSIYYTGPVMLLEALILRLVLDDSIPNEEKNIKKVYEWLTNPGGVDFLDTLFDERMVPPKARACLSPYTTFKGSSPNLQGNLKTNLGAGMQILSTGIIADILSTDDIDLELPGQKPCAYFVQFPVPNKAFKFPIALFFTMIFQTLQQEASMKPNQRLDVCVDFFMDEFAQCGIMPSWDERMSVIRSYGINAFMIVQTLAQFKKNYKDSDETIVSNCATWLMLGANDKSSAQYFCDRFGQVTVEVQSESKAGLKKALGLKNSITDKTSVGAGKANLLNADELMKFPFNELLIVFQGHNPIWANAVPWILHPFHKTEYLKQKAIDEDEPGLYDVEEKKKFREEETARNEEYWSTHSIPVPPKNVRDAPYKKEPTILGDMMEIIKEDIEEIIRALKFIKTKSKTRTNIKEKNKKSNKKAKEEDTINIAEQSLPEDIDLDQTTNDSIADLFFDAADDSTEQSVYESTETVISAAENEHGHIDTTATDDTDLPDQESAVEDPAFADFSEDDSGYTDEFYGDYSTDFGDTEDVVDFSDIDAPGIDDAPEMPEAPQATPPASAPVTSPAPVSAPAPKPTEQPKTTAVTENNKKEAPEGPKKTPEKAPAPTTAQAPVQTPAQTQQETKKEAAPVTGSTNRSQESYSTGYKSVSSPKKSASDPTLTEKVYAEPYKPNDKPPKFDSYMKQEFKSTGVQNSSTFDVNRGKRSAPQASKMVH